MKTCPNCNTQNIEDAKFCESCGKPMTTPGPDPFIGPKNGNDGKPTLGLKILSFLLPIAGFVLAFINMNDPSPEKKAAGKTYLYLGIGGMVAYYLFLGNSYEQY